MEVSAQQIWDSLTVLHETLGYGPRWEHAGNTLTNPDAITQALATGMNRKDTTGEVIPTLGQRIGIGSLDQDNLGLSISVGGTAPTWSGVFLLTPTDRRPPDLDTAKDLMSQLVQTWRPQDMTWSTDKLREAGWDAGLPMKKGVPFAGWLTWVSPNLHDPLPGPVEELAGGACTCSPPPLMRPP
ncbi:hypothetical protein [Serinicoccus sp. CUA-874]|uniref:hypothetical protein n=1 Tax=Serinicoccus sp. CUA-874 TaxID=1517939 RepID=UPI00117BA36A|nr:hypothetical protein [Serinicoccus sp. CUA-874]